MPMSASDYLDSADTLADLAMKAGSPERESLLTAIGQVTAMQAVAAAIERLAEAVENLTGQAAQASDEDRLAAPRLYLAHVPSPPLLEEIGRASCRERVWLDVWATSA